MILLKFINRENRIRSWNRKFVIVDTSAVDLAGKVIFRSSGHVDDEADSKTH
jgi:hypothetical protein